MLGGGAAVGVGTSRVAVTGESGAAVTVMGACVSPRLGGTAIWVWVWGGVPSDLLGSRGTIVMRGSRGGGTDVLGWGSEVLLFAE